MREFRPGKSLVPLIIWATFATGAALLIRDQTREHPAFLLLFWALLLLGPAAAVVHAARAWASSVRVHPELGLILRGGRRLAWGSLRAVRHRPCPFDRDEVPGGRRLREALEDPPPGAHDGFLWVLGLHVLWTLGYYLLLPAFVALSPWPSRVSLSLKDGSELVLKDLDDDRLFVKLVKIGLSGHRNRTARLVRELRQAAA